MNSIALKRMLAKVGVRTALLRLGGRWYPAGRPHIVQTTIRGARMLVLANEDVGRRILLLRQYEPHDANWLLGQIRPDDVCIDIGANTGYYSMLMGAKASGGQVHAFEPVPLNYHMLSCGILLNDFRHVHAVRGAVGSEDGETSFSEASDGAYSSLVPVGRKSEKAQVNVTVRRLDSYLREQAIDVVDVVKIDVEGAETMVLDGASELLGDPRRQPRVMMIELQDMNLATYGASVPAVVERLDGHGYDAYVVLPDGQARRYVDTDRNNYANVFFRSRARS